MIRGVKVKKIMNEKKENKQRETNNEIARNGERNRK